MDKAPKISVVIPSFNSAQFIMESILSVRNQNYENIEIIVADGGSTDGTLDIISSTDLVDIVINGPDKGQSDALNRGFEKATGDIFYWLNSDDIMLPETLSWCIDLFRQNPHTKVVYGAWTTISENGETLSTHLPLPLTQPLSAISPLKVYNQSIFWKADIHNKIGDFDINLHLLMDVDFVIRLLKILPPQAFRLTDQLIGAFRIRKGQKTGARFAKERMKEEQTIREKHHLPALMSPSGIAKRAFARLKQLRAMQKAGGTSYMISELINMIKKI
ncbi:glycosyltransferase [bacterium]|nr:glycosyltransferase [bacterium]